MEQQPTMIAFVFPGQGSQFPGMGKELAANFSVARQVFEEADDTLGFPLSTLCFEGPEEKLRLTEFTQPAILTVSIAVLKVVEAETGLSPVLLAGHSLGEYSALVAAGVLTFSDAVMAVRQRGRFMQEAVPVKTGTMAAVLGLDQEVVEEICSAAAGDQIVAPANFNAPGQIVIAGHCEAVDRALELARERGCRKAIPLSVSAPFHCPLMEPAGLRLQEFFADIVLHSFTTPVVTNAEATANSDPSRVVELLVRQVSSPVLWQDSVVAMIQSGSMRFVELGPGRVLSGLIKRIDKTVYTHSIEGISGLKAFQ
jgi:[acyl-carrier-protein] S-malonyltransferase